MPNSPQRPGTERLGEHLGQHGDRLEAVWHLAAGAQHAGAQDVEGQRGAGQERQRDPDVGLEHLDPAAGSGLPARRVALADEVRVALFDAPVLVGGRLRGIDARVAVDGDGGDQVLGREAEREARKQVGTGYRVLRGLHEEGANQGGGGEDHHQRQHRVLQDLVGACDQQRDRDHGDQAGSPDRRHLGHQERQRLPGAADDPAQPHHSRDDGDQGDDDGKADQSPAQRDLAGQPVHGADVGVSRNQDVAAQLCLDQGLDPARQEHPPEHDEAGGGAEARGEDDLARADDRPRDDDAGTEIAQPAAPVRGRLDRAAFADGVGIAPRRRGVAHRG